MIFLDSSVLVRRYGTRTTVRRPDLSMARGGRGVCVSDLVRVEVHSAMRRRVRDGTMDPDRAAAALDAFTADLPDWVRVPVDERVLRRAAELVGRHPLRSLDAIHLASALVVRDEAPTSLQFGSSDVRLVAAAEAEGFEILRA